MHHFQNFQSIKVFVKLSKLYWMNCLPSVTRKWREGSRTFISYFFVFWVSVLAFKLEKAKFEIQLGLHNLKRFCPILLPQGIDLLVIIWEIIFYGRWMFFLEMITFWICLQKLWKIILKYLRYFWFGYRKAEEFIHFWSPYIRWS